MAFGRNTYKVEYLNPENGSGAQDILGKFKIPNRRFAIAIVSEEHSMPVFAHD